MATTTNLGLTKPGYDDIADIDTINDNMDIIDEQFDGSRLVEKVNGKKPTKGNVVIDIGVSSVNGRTGAVTINEYDNKSIVDLVHPVGCYFETSDKSFNPNTYWPDTKWEQITDGRVHIAGGGGYAVGTQGGEANVKLSVANMPSHQHGATCAGNGNHFHGSMGENYDSSLYGFYDAARNHAGSNGGIDWDNRVWKTSTDGFHSHTITIGNTGGGTAHNNMQPYTAVARWHRTA